MDFRAALGAAHAAGVELAGLAPDWMKCCDRAAIRMLGHLAKWARKPRWGLAPDDSAASADARAAGPLVFSEPDRRPAMLGLGVLRRPRSWCFDVPKAHFLAPPACRRRRFGDLGGATSLPCRWSPGALTCAARDLRAASRSWPFCWRTRRAASGILQRLRRRWPPLACATGRPPAGAWAAGVPCATCAARCRAGCGMRAPGGLAAGLRRHAAPGCLRDGVGNGAGAYRRRRAAHRPTDHGRQMDGLFGLCAAPGLLSGTWARVACPQLPSPQAPCCPRWLHLCTAASAPGGWSSRTAPVWPPPWANSSGGGGAVLAQGLDSDLWRVVADGARAGPLGQGPTAHRRAMRPK